MNWLEALILGAIQGLTEFLPISSDGHLAVAENLFAARRGTSVTGEDALFFNVMLHLGTLAAILLYYRSLVPQVVRGLQGKPDPPPGFQRADLIRTGLLVIAGTIPAAVIGLVFKSAVERATENTFLAALGFFVTSVVLLLVMLIRSGEKGPQSTTWLDAILIGTAQAFAILPGVSRSGMTIASALALGLSRSWSVGFSLLLAVPTILGAAVLELIKVNRSTLETLDPIQSIVATLVAGVVGFGAIVWLVRVVRNGHLWYFSVYLVILASAVLIGFGANQRESADAGPSQALDRTFPSRPTAGGASAAAGVPGEPLDHSPGNHMRAGHPSAHGPGLADRRSS